MLSDIIEYFLPSFLKKGALSQTANLKFLERRRKYSIIIAVGLVNSIMVLFMFMIRFSLEGWASSKSLILLLIASLVTFSQVLAVKYNKKPEAVVYFTLLFSYFVLFRRVPSTGGITSPVSLWYIIQPIAACMMITPRAGLVFLGLSSLQIFMFGYPSILSLHIEYLTPNPLVYAFVITILMIIVTLLVYYYERNRIESELKIGNAQEKLLAQKKLASLGTLSAGIAHEVNNPLMILQGKLYLIKQNLKSTNKIDKEKILQDIGTLENSITRINNIIKAVKTFAEDDHMNETKTCFFHEIISSAWEMLPESCKKNIHFSNRVTAKDLSIIGNEELLRSVFLNLFANACYAIKDQPNPWVRVSVASQSPLTISVMDSGQGIPAQYRDRILDPFFTTKPQGEGTGIGLSLSKGIIHQHNGKLELVNEGKNTEFVLKFKDMMNVA